MRISDWSSDVCSSDLNQKYFACVDSAGKLAPRFIVVANLIAEDGGKAIINGNERVLRARFSDARFLWEQDKKATLESRLPKLKEVVFQAKLGKIGRASCRERGCQYV